MPLDATQTPHPIDVHVGRSLARRRMELGLNQSDLGRALGVTFQQIQKYERGSNRVSASKLWLAASALGVGIDYFYPAAKAGDVVAIDASPPTPRALEMARLFPVLGDSAQRVVLNLARELAASE